MLFQIAFRQVVLRPGQQFVEPCAIVGRQGEKQAIALSFRGGDFARIAGVNHPSSGLTYACLNCSQAGHWQAAPTWPAASSSAEHRATKNFHHGLLIIQAKTAAADDAQHAPQHPCQQHNADGSEDRQQYRVVREREPDALEPGQMTHVVNIPTRRLLTPDSRITATEPNIAARLPLSLRALVSSSLPRGLSASRATTLR